MILHRVAQTALLAGLVMALASCGDGNGFAGGIFGGSNVDAQEAAQADVDRLLDREPGDETLWDLFAGNDDPNVTVEVNRYLWNASLDILSFLPIETVDPFSGVIVTGYGAPPGGGRAYRATVYVQDPALDARSLRVALQSRGGGPVSVETSRAIEDAILTRARQLRIQDSKL